MGMDWHSSGITTSVIGALKRGLAPLAGELGLHVCGGRGKHSRQTPRRARRDRRADRLRRRGAGQGEPAGRQGRQRRRAGRLRSLSARLHRRRRRQMGRRAAGHERRPQTGAALSLAVGGAEELRRGAARRDRRRRRRARSSISPTAAPKPRAAARSTMLRRLWARTDRARVRRAAIAATRRAAPPLGTARAAASRSCRAHHDVRAERRADAAPARQSGRGGRSRPARFRRTAARSRRRRADGARAGDGRRSRARRALPLHRSRAVLARAWRQGPASVSGADQSLRSDDPGAEDRRCARRSSAQTEELAAMRRLDEQARRLERGATAPFADAVRRGAGARTNMADAACLASRQSFSPCASPASARHKARSRSRPQGARRRARRDRAGRGRRRTGSPPMGCQDRDRSPSLP